ncbi:hypothetical protein [Actinoplanes sp. URMC 104]|uniref:hypothetical protein n=1 Tax=Actinoplanes sp. URMC 104 TaxID=3423409 RepID=UPI003F1E308A
MTTGRDTADLGERSRHKQVRVRAAAASHGDASPDLLTAMAQDPSRTIRRIVAGRVDTPPDALRELAGDADRATRQAVATNPATPAEVMIALLSDPHWSVRLSVIDNPSIDRTVQHAMCQATDKDVRLVLAQRPGLPAGISARLARDTKRVVREALAQCTDDPATLQLLLRDDDARVRGCAGMNPGTTVAQRRQLVRDPAWEVRSSVVHAKAVHGWEIPETDLLVLARDRSATVRYWLANLPGATRRVYEVLADDPDADIAFNAGLWLLPADDPRHPDAARNPSGHALPDMLEGMRLTQRHYANPEYLGRPIPQITDIHTAEQRWEVGSNGRQ